MDGPNVHVPYGDLVYNLKIKQGHGDQNGHSFISVQCAVHIVQCTVYSLQFAVRSVVSLYRLHCAKGSVQCE